VNPADTDEATSERTAYPNSTYYLVTGPDLRRCAYPLCGGFFIKRVNRPTTVCSDRSVQAQCRILSFDYRSLGLDTATESELQALVEKGQVLLRGGIRKTSPINGRTYDRFVAQEAWEASALGTPGGTFYRTHRLPLACAACPTFETEQLNTSLPAQLYHRLVFDPARFSPMVSRRIESLAASSDSGVLVAAQPLSGGGMSLLNIFEAYTPFARGPRAGRVGDSCGSRGLPTRCESGAFCKHEREAQCGRFDAAGVCTAKPSACILLYKPVCGCDAKTYDNECSAWSAGVSVDHDGVCR
jgi:hypothetical protein